MLAIRKNMSSSEIREIDQKIANLNQMRNIVFERLASLEQEEAGVEHESMDPGPEVGGGTYADCVKLCLLRTRLRTSRRS